MNILLLFNKLVSPFLFYSGFFKFKWSLLSKKKGLVIVLCYHRVVNNIEEQSGLFNIEKGILVSEFEKQMKFLLKYFQPIHASRAYQNCTPYKMCFAVTFDDGYLDNLEVAGPVLKRLGIPCTFFIVSEYVGTDRLFWWELLAQMFRKTTVSEFSMPSTGESDQGFNEIISLKSFTEKEIAHEKISSRLFTCSQQEIDKILLRLLHLLKLEDISFAREYPLLSWEELKNVNSNEIEIGAHTATHCNLAKTDSLELFVEIGESIALTEKKLSKKIKIFAYPYGTLKHFNEQVIDFVKLTECESAYTVCRGGVSKSSDPFVLPRVFFNNKYSFIWAYNIEMALKKNGY